MMQPVTAPVPGPASRIFCGAAAVADVTAQRVAQRAAARNDRAGRVVVTKKLGEEGLVIGQPIHSSISVIANDERPDARNVHLFDRRGAQSGLREERRADRNRI